MNNINHNGQIIPADQLLLSAQNRAFRYGDGLFETMRVIHGKIPFLKYHFQRLISGLDVLQISVPVTFTIDFFQKEILRLTGNSSLSRVRFTAYRSDGGLYLPDNDDLQYLIEIKELQQDCYKWNNVGLHTGLFENIPLTYSVLSPLKSLNALPYILASKYKKAKVLDDVFLINKHGRLAEASSSNVILLDGDKWLTPPIEEACVAGIIRSVLLENGTRSDFRLQEKELTISELKNAKVIFLTNSIQGIKWVSQFQEKLFSADLAAKAGKPLLDCLNLAAKEVI